MVFLSIEDKIEKKNVNKILTEYDLDKKVFDEDKVYFDDNNDEILKKCKIVICDGDIEKVKKYKSLKKIVIYYKKNNYELKDPIFFQKGVYTYTRKNELREILSYQLKKKHFSKKIVMVMIIFILLISIGVFINNYINNILEEKRIEREKYIQELIKKQNEEKLKRENIVFLGDSITDFYDLEKFYPDYVVINSGTSGKRAVEIKEELKDRVYKYNPTKVFFLIGTNDLAHDRTNDQIVEDIETSIKRIKKNRPMAELYLESIYPVHNKVDDDKILEYLVKPRPSKEIEKINKRLKEVCEKQNVTYIDMFELLKNDNNELKIDYTKDGLHINEEGYKVITEKIMSYIKPKDEKVDKK